MKKINTALFCIFVLLFCSCDVLNKAPLDEIADDSFWSDETLVKYYVNDLYSEISVDGLQLQENRSDNSVSAQRDKYRASWFKFNYDMVSASDPQDDDVWEDYYVNATVFSNESVRLPSKKARSQDLREKFTSCVPCSISKW